ncbi:MAG: type I secretion system permease/ATPase [Arcobacteraceae bacterium]|nr:type I secretion system permease/ATPase [Arcobacteraceae bacterium]MDX9795198.1 type I secretion system permease/ATPase [Arcobacteraceae bacterium]
MNDIKTPLLCAFKYMLDFYYGEVNIDTILNLDAVKDGEFNKASIFIVCDQIGLIALEKEMSAQNIPNHFLPCIIFDESDTPLIYQKNIANKKIELYNAKEEKRFEIAFNELNHYKKALLIFREENKKKLLDKVSNNNWFWEPVKSFWKSYIEVGILTFFINLFALFTPLFIMTVYDRVVPNEAYETLFVLSFGLIIVLIFELVFKSVRNHIIDKTGKKLSLYLEEDLMKRVLTLQSQYDTMMTGAKANLFRELATVRDFFATKSIVQIIDFPFFIFALIAIYFISPAVALVPFLIAVVVVLINLSLQIPIANLSKKHLENIQSKQNYLVESIQGSDTVKLSNAISSKLFNWRTIIAHAENIQLKIQRVNAFALNTSQSLIQLTTILVVVVGVFQISDKELSVGGLIAVTILASRSMVPVISLSTMVIKFKEIKDSLYNLRDFWDLPLENEKNIEIGLGKLKGDIEFKQVTYYFKNAKYPSVNAINFSIKNGEKIGIIGQTGAGKSTLLKLLTGLLHPTKGSIFIDNHDISTIHPVEIRQNIGVMTQDPFLFNGTLKENIELSRPISKEKMMETITLTGLEELVKRSGQGDGIPVGERGCNLSTGQKHLVALARAIVNDPSILILDEPTTGLDVGLEKKLMENLKHIIQNKTLILITHRFAALELVDRILVLSNGKIVADGPRDAVLNALKNPKG